MSIEFEDTVRGNSLKDDFKRLLINWQLFKTSLECIRTSDTIKEFAAVAKQNKNKNFVDLRVLAAEQQRSLDAMILKIKRTMQPDTWNAVMNTLTGEQIKEIDLLINEITVLDDHVIEGITKNVKQAKIDAGIPLNDPYDSFYEDNKTENQNPGD
jgi:hypothetical protein